MEIIAWFVDVVLHLDKHLAVLVSQYGTWIYAILFAVIFCETGLVVTPFLPGDSLLFIAGSLCALGSMNVHLLVLLLFIAAVLGNISNYEIGRAFGSRFFKNPDSRWMHPKRLDATRAFFERWGGWTVIVARFVPFIRTYVPFVAGMGAMPRPRYLMYTVVGGAVWVGSLTYLGYFFGNVPWIKANTGFLVIGIIVVSLLPVVIGVVKARIAAKRNQGGAV